MAYAILGCAPAQGHINACATLWLPIDIFDFDMQPDANGPTKVFDSSKVRIEKNQTAFYELNKLPKD